MGASLPGPLRLAGTAHPDRSAAPAAAAVAAGRRTPRAHPLPQDGFLGVHQPARSPPCATASRTPPTALLDGLADETRRASTSSSATARNCRSPSSARSSAYPKPIAPKILEFGEFAAPSLDFGLSWRAVPDGAARAGGLQRLARSTHLQQLRDHPGDDLMSQLIDASEDGVRLNETELRAIAGPGARGRFRDHGQPARQRDPAAAQPSRPTGDAGRRSVAVAERRRGDPATTTPRFSSPHGWPAPTPRSPAPRSAAASWW